jgi:hypothetical protein
MLVNCYFIREGGKLTHQQIDLEPRFEGALPETYFISYDAALDENVRDRFDPRANWDQWCTGKDPFARKVELQLTQAFGCTYLDSTLYKSALKHFPQLNVPKTPIDEMITYHHPSIKDMLNDQDWEPINLTFKDMMKKPKKKAPDTFVIPRSAL